MVDCFGISVALVLDWVGWVWVGLGDFWVVGLFVWFWFADVGALLCWLCCLGGVVRCFVCRDFGFGLIGCLCFMLVYGHRMFCFG